MIESIGGITSQPLSQSINANDLGQADLFRILLTQLTFQDPLKPLDNREFITQLAQFSGLEVNRQVSDSISTLLSMQSVSQSMGLLGNNVEVQMDNGTTVTGKVTALTMVDGVPKATVQQSNGDYITDLSVANIRRVILPSAGA